MNLAAFGAIFAIVAGYAGGLIAILRMLGSRLDRIEDDIRGLRTDLTHLTDEVHGLRTDVAVIGQRLDDHITDHPGPTRQLSR